MLWKGVLASLGGVSAAIASALCCAGPLLAVTIGVSGAGFASSFEPLRPYLLGVTAASLGAGFWLLRREEQVACEPGRPCASPLVRRRYRTVLWIATVLAVVFASWPTWSGWIM